MRHMGHNVRFGRYPRTVAVAMSSAIAIGAWAGTGRPALADEGATTQPATTQPASVDPPADGGDRPDRDGQRGRRGPGGFGARRWFGQGVGDIDPTESNQFMSDHAPQYWRWVSNMPEERRRAVEATVATAYATYQRLRPDDPELYKVIVERVEVEDRVFALRMKVRQAQGQSPATARDALAAEVRAQLTKSTELVFKERELRLARLKRMVDQQEKALATDDANRNDLISRRLEQIMSGGGGGGGPFPGGGNFRIDGRGDGGDAGASR